MLSFDKRLRAIKKVELAKVSQYLVSAMHSIRGDGVVDPLSDDLFIHSIYCQYGRVIQRMAT